MLQAGGQRAGPAMTNERWKKSAKRNFAEVGASPALCHHNNGLIIDARAHGNPRLGCLTTARRLSHPASVRGCARQMACAAAWTVPKGCQGIERPLRLCTDWLWMPTTAMFMADMFRDQHPAMQPARQAADERVFCGNDHVPSSAAPRFGLMAARMMEGRPHHFGGQGLLASPAHASHSSPIQQRRRWGTRALPRGTRTWMFWG
jgi:hypothetical protein